MRFLHTVYDLQPLFFLEPWPYLHRGSQPLKEKLNKRFLWTGCIFQCRWAWIAFSAILENITDTMIPTHTYTYTSIKCTEIILKWFPLPYLILTLATSYKLRLSEARARILALLHAIRNDRLYSGNLCTKKKNQNKKQNKQQTIKEEKIRTFHKLCFQTSLVRYEGPTSWFSPGQLEAANQRNGNALLAPRAVGMLPPFTVSIQETRNLLEKLPATPHGQRHSPFHISPSSLRLGGSVAICLSKMLLV